MLDRYTLPVLKPLLAPLARRFDRGGVTADQLTVTGFLIGMMAVPAVIVGYPWLALLPIAGNRLFDGVDGELARLHGPSDAGAFLDIVLDFLFYAAIVGAFAWADPSRNALAAATLLMAFVGTGASFLAFSALAEKRQIRRTDYPPKGIFYLQGLTEGTETLAFLVLMCCFPAWFTSLAFLFAALCAVTIVTRVIGGYRTLRYTQMQSR